MKKRINFISLASIILLFIFSIPLYSQNFEKQVSDISKELMCPVCRGQTVSESNSDLAKDFRDVIKKKLQEGQSKEEILNYFTSRYGDSVLASPPAKGFRLVVWLLPLAAIITGFIFLTYFIRSKSGNEKNIKDNKEINDLLLDEVDKELKELD